VAASLYPGVIRDAVQANQPEVRGLPFVRPLLPERRSIYDVIDADAYACMCFGFV
jgi:hypothetical protein